MAANYTRSMNGDLAEGMTDGKYKKITQDRGGDVGTATFRARKDLDDIWHGMHELQTKTLPDGTVRTTPDYLANSQPSLERG